MKITPHGGDIQTFVERFGCEPLDYSANTNPLGISPAAKAAISKALDQADRYPDPYCRQLRNALSEKEGVDVDHIICGNGAADLIFRLVMTVQPKKALLLAPTFSEYEESLVQGGSDISYFYLQEENDFALTEEILPLITPDLDILFICEPNNPTGKCSSPTLLKTIAQRCADTETMLVVDECFNGFLTEPDTQSLKHLIQHMPHLVILKAFTKLYGMAGVRLGYLFCSNNQVMDRMSKTGQHWAVSSLAQAAGCAALAENEWLRQGKEIIAQERPRLIEGLRAAQCKIYESDANYLLFQSTPFLGEYLAKQGILIRDCSNYKGLEKGYFRIAVRTHAENNRFLDALSQVVSETGTIKPTLNEEN